MILNSTRFLLHRGLANFVFLLKKNWLETKIIEIIPSYKLLYPYAKKHKQKKPVQSTYFIEKKKTLITLINKTETTWKQKKFWEDKVDKIRV